MQVNDHIETTTGPWLDLRSDTVTHPTDKMRRAMALAPVGDDVYGDDLTTLALERSAAEIFQKEAALFVPSGTFGNQLALMTHCRRGDEVIVGEDAHIVIHEVGAAAVLAGVNLKTLPTNRGHMAPEAISRAVRTDDIHYPETGLICLENAHGCGAVLSEAYMAEVYALAKTHGIPLHVDGARIFNAAAANNTSVAKLAAHCDTINVCLSKGLCAPVGSLLIGPKAFIQRARKLRKLMGGGMRQTGILAAAGMIAIEEMGNRLMADHKRAEAMTELLATYGDIEVLRDFRDINMVFFKLPASKISEADFVEGMKAQGIKINGMEDGIYRFVTHYWITDTSLERLKTALDLLLR